MSLNGDPIANIVPSLLNATENPSWSLLIVPSMLLPILLQVPLLFSNTLTVPESVVPLELGLARFEPIATTSPFPLNATENPAWSLEPVPSKVESVLILVQIPLLLLYTLTLPALFPPPSLYGAPIAKTVPSSLNATE